MAAESWSRTQRRLHWVAAGLIAAAFPLGFVMAAVPLRDLLAKFLLYDLHKSIGLLVAVFAAWRLGLRARRGRPATNLPAGEARRAALGQAALYLLMLAVPVLGYLTACAAPGGIPTFFLLVVPVPALLAPDPALYAWLRPAHL
ncbi:MAG: cytochrome b/b6 domain-containing protein, partial [Rhodospirillales bacterium]|nr:cytochrome b/b6 domain-containing protein [Rhodospirillales bacterium]